MLKAYLKETPYFKTLTADELEVLVNASRMISKKAGELILRSGEEATHYYLLQKGIVSSYFLKPNGKRFIMQTHTEGTLFFVSPALAQTRYGGYLEAFEDATIIAIPSAETLRIVKRNLPFAQSLLHLTINDNLHLNDTINNFLVDARSRFSRFLLRRALESGERVKGELRLDLGMSKSDIAAALDLSPETLSRTIAQMKAEQVIDMDNALVTIRNLRGLVLISESL